MDIDDSDNEFLAITHHTVTNTQLLLSNMGGEPTTTNRKFRDFYDIWVAIVITCSCISRGKLAVLIMEPGNSTGTRGTYRVACLHHCCTKAEQQNQNLC